jgi:hypothetical protein
MRFVDSPRGIVVVIEGSEISNFFDDSSYVIAKGTERLPFAPAYIEVRNEDWDLLGEIHVDSLPRSLLPSSPTTKKPDRPAWMKKVRSLFGYTDNPATPHGTAMNPPYDENPADEEERLDEKAKAIGARYRGRSETLADYRARLSHHRDDNPRGRYVGVHGRHAFHATRGNHPSYAHPVHGPYASPARASSIARRAHKKMEDYKDNPGGYEDNPLRYVIRRGWRPGVEPAYLDKNGAWAERKAAKKFASQDQAESFADGFGIRDYGLFPVGTDSRRYDDNPRSYEENPGFTGYEENPALTPSDTIDIEALAQMFGIPTFEEAWNEDVDWEAFDYARKEALENGASDDEADEKGRDAEQEDSGERFRLWHDAVTSAVEHEFEEHGLTLVPRTGRGRDSRTPWEYRVVPTVSWTDAARKILHTINGVGMFEFRNVREFLDSGPYTARQAVLKHLHWLKDRAEVYGDRSARDRYHSALR